MNFCRSIIIAELWRPVVARRWNIFFRFFAFFGKKTTPYGKIFKTLFQEDSSSHLSTCYVQISWNLADRKSVKSCVAYLTENNKNSPGSPALATAWIRPKIYHSQPQTIYSECSTFHPNRFTFGGVIAERVNTIRARSKVNPIFGWSLASSRITILQEFSYALLLSHTRHA